MYLSCHVQNASMWTVNMKYSDRYEVGIIAGAFPLIHPGYVEMFRQAKQYCNRLVIALHVDPSIEHPEKKSPVFSEDERATILRAMRDVDSVISYRDENQLVELLEMLTPDVRFLGDDYLDKPITGAELSIPIVYIERTTGWSTTRLMQEIQIACHKDDIYHFMFGFVS